MKLDVLGLDIPLGSQTISPFRLIAVRGGKAR